jgi:hypothetical protein
MPFEIPDSYWMNVMFIIYYLLFFILPQIDETIDTAIDDCATTKVATIYWTDVDWQCIDSIANDQL